MTDVINDALGLAQFLTGHLGADATQYLVGVTEIGTDEWKIAKEVLSTECPRLKSINRTTKELTIKDIVTAFIESDIENAYIVRNLSLCPGFSAEAIELTKSYISSSLYAIKHVATTIIENSKSEVEPSITQSSTERGIASSGQSAVTSNASGGDSPFAIVDKHSGYLGALKHNLQPQQSSQRSGSKKPKKNSWVTGSDYRNFGNRTPQLKYICLAIKSGPEETKESLRKQFDKWKNLFVKNDLRIDPVSVFPHSTLFRVQFTSPAGHYDKWTEQATWPAWISVRLWRGNPRQELRPLDDRIYRKKIYVGNLKPDTKMETVEANLKEIYEEEIESGLIAEIKAYPHLTAWERQLELQHRNPNHKPRQSACVVLTSAPGKHLAEVGLNLHHYPYDQRPAIRYWTGPVPWPEETRNTDAVKALADW